MTRVLRTQFIAGHRIEDLSNGNVLVDGVAEVVPPNDWAKPDTRWMMHDAAGNIIVGSLLDDHEPFVIERDPTPAEAQEQISHEMEQLQRSGKPAQMALKIALERWPRHARVYCAS